MAKSSVSKKAIKKQAVTNVSIFDEFGEIQRTTRTLKVLSELAWPGNKKPLSGRSQGLKKRQTDGCHLFL
jgi:hypothetical protein